MLTWKVHFELETIFRWDARRTDGFRWIISKLIGNFYGLHLRPRCRTIMIQFETVREAEVFLTRFAGNTYGVTNFTLLKTALFVLPLLLWATTVDVIDHNNVWITPRTDRNRTKTELTKTQSTQIQTHMAGRKKGTPRLRFRTCKNQNCQRY